MGIIRDKVSDVFSQYKKSIEDGTEQEEALKKFAFGLVEIADRSVQSAGHRAILDEAINVEFDLMREW